MKQLLNDDRRGQVGIGTLIVFIAMVLVAAIAAGVLINTAGFLQNQAEDTGTESTEQVADNLNVITEVGEVSDRGDGEDQIDFLRIGVQPASGADDINLAELTVQYVSDSDFANLVVGVDSNTGADSTDSNQAQGDSDPTDILISSNNSPDNGADEEYAVDVITAENPDDLVMTDNADRYEIVIPLADSNTGSGVSVGNYDSLDGDSDVGSLSPLDEGEEVELTITTEVGSQTVAFLQVPDSLSGNSGGDTVNL
jgi:flagellin FlaB